MNDRKIALGWLGKMARFSHDDRRGIAPRAAMIQAIATI
jgi:hypothetical protein